MVGVPQNPFAGTRRAGFGANQNAFLNALTGTAQGVAQGISNAAQLPGNILMGNTGFDPRLGFSGQSPQTLDAAANLAGMVTLGSGAMPAEANSLNMGLRAFHGSPYDFDKFDIAKIGNGEGNQSFGHGLYFAENENVAKSYKEALAGNLGNYDDILPKYFAPGNIVPSYGGRDRVLAFEKGADPGQFQVQVQELDRSGNPVGRPRWHSTMPTQKNVKDALGVEFGKMYEVDINADPTDMLHWDKPLAQQAPHVQDAVLKVRYGDNPAAISMAKANPDYMNRSGQSFMYDLQHPEGLSGGPTQASAALKDAGVPGIAYKDGQSRGTSGGSHNYVVFDNDLINVMRKYGVAPGAVGAGALAATQGAKPEPAKINRLTTPAAQLSA